MSRLQAPSDVPRQDALTGPRGRVTAVAFGQILSWGGIYYAFAAMSGALHADEGWPLPAINGAISVGLVATALQVFTLVAHWGIDPARTTVAMMLIGPAQVGGRLALVSLWPEMRPRRLGMGLMAAIGGSALLLMAAPAWTWTLFAFAVLFGLCNGMLTLLRGTAVGSIFGTGRYAEINGALAGFSMFCKGPVAGGPRRALGGQRKSLRAARRGGGSGGVGSGGRPSRHVRAGSFSIPRLTSIAPVLAARLAFQNRAVGVGGEIATFLDHPPDLRASPLDA